MFSILLELHILDAPTERTCHSFHSYSFLRLTHEMILPFSNNCDDKKFILLSEDFQNRFSSSVLIQLLNHKKWENISGVWGDVDRYWLQLINICLKKGSSFCELDLLKESFGWDLNEGPNVFFNTYKGMIFHSWKQLPYNCFTYEIWKLVNLFFIATFFKPPSLKFLQIVCFSLRLLISQKKVWIVSKVLMMWLGTDTIKNCFWHC